MRHKLFPSLHFAGPLSQTSEGQRRLGNQEIFSILTVQESGVTFEQASKIYGGCADEILRMCLRGTSGKPGDVKGDVSGVFRHESFAKAVRHRCCADLSGMMAHVLKGWFEEEVAGTSVDTVSRPVGDDKENRMRRQKKLMELDDD